jgi:MEMO1 family protein
MGKIISSYILPHPPVIVPEVGKGSEKGSEETISAVISVARNISDEKPTTIIITTPHGPVFQDYIYMSTDQELTGNLSRFGASEPKFVFENNIDLVSRIIEFARQENIPAGGLDEELIKKFKLQKQLDHGAIVPLYFVNKQYNKFKLVHISISGLPFTRLYKFGMCISKAVEQSNERVVFIASGDLSHKLSSDAPYGYDKTGEEFDKLFIESIKNLDVEKLLNLDESFCESAGECGLRSFLMMFGALDGYELKPEVYSYEGPFGVGYSVARFKSGEIDENRQILKRIENKSAERIKSLRSNESLYVALARNALEVYVNEGRTIKVPELIPKEMIENKAGTFVSIKKSGQLRGCIGTTGPTRKNIAEEIIYNAISSGTRDPRFYPVKQDELKELVYSVDVLKEPEPIKTIDELDVIKYGVIVRTNKKSGLLLPNLEGVDTKEKQVSIALQKAGIKPEETYNMERFEVVRYL